MKKKNFLDKVSGSTQVQNIIWKINTKILKIFIQNKQIKDYTLTCYLDYKPKISWTFNFTTKLKLKVIAVKHIEKKDQYKHKDN